MEQSVLRPKPMPGQAGGDRTGTGPARRPSTGRRWGRRLGALLSGLAAGAVLLLAGVGLGTVGATVIGATQLAQLQRQAGGHPAGAAPEAAPAPGTAPAPAATPSRARAGATLGIEAVDTDRPGALVVGVHMPGPGYSAGLVRGDVLLAFGTTRIDSAAELAQAVARARPGAEVKLTVRHESGAYQQLTVVPGVVT